MLSLRVASELLSLERDMSNCYSLLIFEGKLLLYSLVMIWVIDGMTGIDGFEDFLTIGAF